jgi:hypothetical protein
LQAIAMDNRTNGASVACGENRSMQREFLTTIWSLRRRQGIQVRIYYRARAIRHCRLLHLQQVEEMTE